MKRKFYGVLMLGALAIASASLTSCKDYDDDINNLQTQVNSLSQTVDQKETAIKQLITNLDEAYKKADADLKTAVEAGYSAGDVATLAAAKSAIEEAKTALQNAINQNKSDIADLVRVNNLQDAAILSAQNAADQALAQISQLSSSLNTKVNEIKSDLSSLSTSLTQVQSDLAGLSAKYNSLSTELASAVADIAELKTAVKGQQAALEAFSNGSGDYSKIKDDITALLTKLSALETQVNAMTTGQTTTVAQEITTIKSDLEPLKTSVSTLETQIDAVNKDLNTIATALAKALRSLVYVPSLYVDGIESIEYPYVVDTAIVEDANSMDKDRPARTTQGFEDAGKKIIEAKGTAAAKLAKLRDWKFPASGFSVDYFGPAWPVDYHMNPSRATIAWEDIQGWNRRNAEVITRSTAGDNGAIQLRDKYADGTQLFGVKNGIVTVGLKVTDPKNLANHATPTEKDGRPGKATEEKTTSNYQYDDIIALQVKSGKDTLITSDYAMIYPEKVWPEAIIWNNKPNKLYRNTINFDEKCPYDGTVHVWDNPYEALGCNDATVYPDIELQYDDEKGIRLGDYLGIHYVRDCKTLSKKVPGTWAYGEEAKWGFYYEFQRVGYSIDGNITIDSNYALFKDEDANGVSKEGVIEAWNVDASGNTIKEKNLAAVGREPLVRVFVKRISDDKPVLDGYILIHITRKAADTPTEKEDLAYEPGSLKFDLCNAGNVLETNWSQFNEIVLSGKHSTKLGQMTKEEFDEFYGFTSAAGVVYPGVPDLKSTTTSAVPGSDGLVYEDVQLYDDANGTKADMTKHPGTLRYFRNNNATTNHKFIWVMSEEDLEYNTHDKASLPVTITKYIRYTKKTVANKPDYVYVKIETKLDRVAIPTSGITEKNINYWFSANSASLGADDGFDAIFFNPQFPADGGLSFQFPTQGMKNVFNNDIYNTFAGNKVNFTNGYSSYNALAYNNNDRNNTAKFYFVPKTTTITSQAGVTYTITPQSSASDTKWNQYICKYISTDKHQWKENPADNEKILNNCAIDYNAGLFTNDKLYAKVGNVYTEIATLDQNITTGHVELTFRNPDDDVTKEVLNAIGYEAEHKNVLTELHAMVGVVAKNSCNVAIYVNEYVADADNKNAGSFWVSWNRPINVDTNEKGLQDAKNNGDYVYLVDMLKLYDWRGPADGYMYDAQQWLWAYYNVKSVTIDVTPSKVMTNMNQTDPNKFVKLSDVTTRARLRTMAGGQTQTIDFTTLITAHTYPTYYNEESKNADLLADLGIDPEDNDVKALFGGVYYENNGEHVETFDLIIPIQVNYGWGRFISDVRVKVNRTLGH
jgi:peptidoglycan hydrolase CwlO-like protein